MKDAHAAAAAAHAAAAEPEARPVQRLAGQRVTIIHARRPSQALLEVEAAIRANPCPVVGHRAAWLVSGGMACGVCGCPL